MTEQENVTFVTGDCLIVYIEASSPRVNGDTAILSTAQSKLAGMSHILFLNFIQCNHFFFSWREIHLIWFYFIFYIFNNRIAGENHRPGASYWQTLSHNAVSSTRQVQKNNVTIVIHSCSINLNLLVIPLVSLIT
jgi:hypothetical protein